MRLRNDPQTIVKIVASFPSANAGLISITPFIISSSEPTRNIGKRFKVIMDDDSGCFTLLETLRYPAPDAGYYQIYTNTAFPLTRTQKD